MQFPPEVMHLNRFLSVLMDLEFVFGGLIVMIWVYIADYDEVLRQVREDYLFAGVLQFDVQYGCLLILFADQRQ